MRHERCDTGMCMVRLFQLAEPIHPSLHEKNQKSESISITEEINRRDDDASTSSRASAPGAAAEITPNNEFRHSMNILFPVSAPYNSQSGQPVPANVTRRDTIVFDAYPFDESGTEEVEGRGGPQVSYNYWPMIPLCYAWGGYGHLLMCGDIDGEGGARWYGGMDREYIAAKWSIQTSIKQKPTNINLQTIISLHSSPSLS